MAHVIEFRTARFHVSTETPNPINPIAGQSVLSWLREELSNRQYKVTEPATEDWGWYMDVEGGGESWLVGASADAGAETADVDWVVQVHKSRSMMEKLLGRNKMAGDYPLSALVENLVRSDSRIEGVSVTRDA